MADASVVGNVPSSSDDEEEVFTYRLRIHDANFDDGGKWKCEVKDKYGTISTQCDLEIFDNQQIKKAIESARQARSEVVQKTEESVTKSEESVLYSPLAEKLKTYDEYVEEHEPGFLQSLKNSSVSEGGVARLSCIVTGTPKPQAKWYKDNIEIKEDGRISIVELRDGTNYLEFSSAASKDSAVYKCEVTSAIGQACSEAKLSVKKKKQYSRIYKAQDLGEHREMLSSLKQRITDNIEETDAINSTRYKHRNEINMMKSLYATEREADLKLKCKWEEEQQLYFRNNLNNKCVVDSGNILLRCYVVGKPPFKARWFKDGKLLSDNVYERHFIRTRGGQMSLEIPCASISDTGEYSCEARNEQGRVTSTCYIQVEPKFDTRMEYEMPYFVEKIRHIHVLPGQDATFACTVKGNPKPGIVWYKDGKEVQHSSRITFHRQNNGSMLKIHEAKYSDTGLYKCEAHSMAGRAVSSAKLVVVESDGFHADFHRNHEKVEFSSSRREVEEIDIISAFEPEVMFKESVSSVIFPRIASFKSLLPESVDIQEGERLVLSCRVDGFPKPEVTWLRNSDIVKDSGYLYTLSEKGVQSLKIQACVSERDAGIYTIKLNAGTKQEVVSTCHVKIVGTISFKQTLPKNLQVKEGEKLVIKFSAEGNPKPEVLWMFNSDELKGGDYYRIYTEGDTFHLEISSLDSKRDSGIYTAKITSGGAERICTCEVQVMRAPTFSKTLPKYVQVENGNKLLLKCAGDGHPKPEATWYRNNRILEQEDSYLRMDAVDDTYSLEIPKTECKRDSGGYIVRLTSGTLSSESSSHVDVTRAPTFISSIPQSVDITEGDRLSLKCVVDGVPPPEVFWYLNDTELRHGEHLQITAMEGRHTLQINKVDAKRDSGLYTVRLIAGTNQVEAACNVAILREAGFTTVVPKESKIENGEKLLLQCAVDGTPPPKVSWLHDGVNLKDADYVKIQAVDGNMSLEIPKVDFKRDSGTYTVKIVGSKSKAECTCNVEITSAPVFSTHLPEVVQVGLGESLILKCNASGNPKPEVKWLHYGKEIEKSDAIRISSKGDTHTLEITKPVYPRDCGVYTLRLTSGDKQSESSCNVDIMRAPSFKQELGKTTEVKSGEKLLLTCSVDGLPKPEVVWLFNGEELKDKDYIKQSFANDIYSLEISEPDSKRDSGTYTARLVTPTSKKESSCDVQIKKAPHFTTPLSSTVQVGDGEQITLTCSIDGNPKPSVVWLHNGKEVKDEDYVKLSTSDGTCKLVIAKPVSSRDSGTYTVRLTNNTGTEESSCEVLMQRPISISESLPSDANVKSGGSLILSVKVDAFPLPEVMWLRNGKELKDENYVRISHADKTYTMSIINPDYKRDSGNYTVKLVSGDSKKECSCDVQIMSDPKFSIPLPSDVQGKCGEKFLLICNAEGNPKPQVTWLFNGKEIKDADYVKLTSADDVYTLELPKPEYKRDSGSYTVRMVNGDKVEECKCQVTITSPPKFTKPLLSNLKVKENESITMSCAAEGNPRPEAVWLLNGKEFKSSDRVKLTASDDSYTLEIKNPDYKSDSGNYTVRLVSGSATEESTCNVQILRHPSFSKALPEVLDVKSGNKLSLSCSIEGCPTPEVVWLHNGKKIESNDSVKLVSSENTCGLEITKASFPKESGSYTAKIANSEGEKQCSCTVNVLSAPFFITKLPESMQADEGESVSLVCKLDGNPKPEVKWLHNSNDLQQDKTAKISCVENEHKLEIQKVAYDKNSGTYTAQIKNDISQEESKCEVKVLPKAKTEETKEVIEELKETISELPQEQFEPKNKGEEPTSSPSISPAIVIYEQLQSNWGDLPEYKETPGFEKPLNKEYYPLEMDENVRIECTVSGTPCPEVVWKKDGIPVERSSRVKMYFDPETRLASIIIKKLKAEDSGEYECTATSLSGTCVSKTMLHVKFLEMQKVESQLPPESGDRAKPIFTVPLKDISLKVGTSGRLECVFEGKPLPATKWFKDGEEFLTIPGKVIITTAGGYSMLQIERMESGYSGVFTCEATNIEGTSASTANVTVQDDTEDVVDSTDVNVPVFTEMPEENLTVPAGGAVAFKCSTSGYPIPKFRWQKDKLDIVQSNRIIVDSRKPGQSTLAIYNVKPYDGGLYICTAKNRYGRCKASSFLRVLGGEDETLSRRMTWSEESSVSVSKTSFYRSASIQMTEISEYKHIDDLVVDQSPPLISQEQKGKVDAEFFKEAPSDKLAAKVEDIISSLEDQKDQDIQSCEGTASTNETSYETFAESTSQSTYEEVALPLKVSNQSNDDLFIQDTSVSNSDFIAVEPEYSDIDSRTDFKEIFTENDQLNHLKDKMSIPDKNDTGIGGTVSSDVDETMLIVTTGDTDLAQNVKTIQTTTETSVENENIAAIVSKQEQVDDIVYYDSTKMKVIDADSKLQTLSYIGNVKDKTRETTIASKRHHSNVKNNDNIKKMNDEDMVLKMQKCEKNKINGVKKNKINGVKKETLTSSTVKQITMFSSNKEIIVDTGVDYDTKEQECITESEETKAEFTISEGKESPKEDAETQSDVQDGKDKSPETLKAEESPKAEAEKAKSTETEVPKEKPVQKEEDSKLSKPTDTMEEKKEPVSETMEKDKVDSATEKTPTDKKDAKGDNKVELVKADEVDGNTVSKVAAPVDEKVMAEVVPEVEASISEKKEQPANEKDIKPTESAGTDDAASVKNNEATDLKDTPTQLEKVDTLKTKDTEKDKVTATKKDEVDAKMIVESTTQKTVADDSSSKTKLSEGKVENEIKIVEPVEKPCNLKIDEYKSDEIFDEIPSVKQINKLDQPSALSFNDKLVSDKGILDKDVEDSMEIPAGVADDQRGDIIERFESGSDEHNVTETDAIKHSLVSSITGQEYIDFLQTDKPGEEILTFVKQESDPVKTSESTTDDTLLKHETETFRSLKHERDAVKTTENIADDSTSLKQETKTSTSFKQESDAVKTTENIADETTSLKHETEKLTSVKQESDAVKTTESTTSLKQETEKFAPIQESDSVKETESSADTISLKHETEIITSSKRENDAITESSTLVKQESDAVKTSESSADDITSLKQKTKTFTSVKQESDAVKTSESIADDTISLKQETEESTLIKKDSDALKTTESSVDDTTSLKQETETSTSIKQASDAVKTTESSADGTTSLKQETKTLTSVKQESDAVKTTESIADDTTSLKHETEKLTLVKQESDAVKTTESTTSLKQETDIFASIKESDAMKGTESSADNLISLKHETEIITTIKQGSDGMTESRTYDKTSLKHETETSTSVNQESDAVNTTESIADDTTSLKHETETSTSIKQERDAVKTTESTASLKQKTEKIAPIKESDGVKGTESSADDTISLKHETEIITSIKQKSDAVEIHESSADDAYVNSDKTKINGLDKMQTVKSATDDAVLVKVETDICQTYSSVTEVVSDDTSSVLSRQNMDESRHTFEEQSYDAKQENMERNTSILDDSGSEAIEQDSATCVVPKVATVNDKNDFNECSYDTKSSNDTKPSELRKRHKMGTEIETKILDENKKHAVGEISDMGLLVLDRLERKVEVELVDRQTVKRSKDSSSKVVSSSQSEQSVREMKVKTIETVEESRQALSETSRSSSKMEILEVSAVKVTGQKQELATVESQATKVVHEHHPPELIVPAHSERLPVHSEIELMVKVKASKKARATWYHDDKAIKYTEHTELVVEGEPIKE